MRRQGVEAVEGQQVGDGSELAVLLGGRAERAGRQCAGQRHGCCRVGKRSAAVAADGNRLDLLRAEDGAEAAPARVAAVVAERGERDQALAGRSDRRDLPVTPVLGADAVLGGPGGEAPEWSGRPPLDSGRTRARAVDEDDRRSRAGAADHQGVDPDALRRDGEVR